MSTVRASFQPRARGDVAAGGAALLLAVTSLVWHLTGTAEPADHGPSFAAMPIAAAFGYGATATVLAWHGRARVVRRVLLGIGFAQGVASMAGLYADAGLAADERWPLTAGVFWLGSWLWSPAYVAVGALLPLVLPDGRPLWRPAAVLSGAAVGCTALWWALLPYELQDFPTTNGLSNPVGLNVVASPSLAAGVIGLNAVAVAVALVSAAVRWRRSTGAERDQLKWLLLGLVATVVLAASAFFVAPRTGAALAALAMLPFPAACGVALVRHRLWDVDLVLSRSLLYGLMTGVVVSGYVVAVALLGGLLGGTAGAPVLATALVALLVLPLHGRLQRVVNRLVHGDAEDPYTALARLGDRLEASADPGELAEHLLPELMAQVGRVLRVPYAAVELPDGSLAQHGVVAARTTATALLFGGQEVGRLVVAGDQLSRADRMLLDQLARQAAVAVHSVLLSRDVSRARAVTATAREEERRRLRRDLHDGMGPALAAVALQAETARDLVDLDPTAAKALLDRLVPRLNHAVADVRTLVHDLRPPTLDELGLAGALRELAAHFATPDRSVRVEAAPLPELPAAVDLAAYRIAAEALHNAARHADAASLLVSLACDQDRLRLTVRDDGRGLPEGAPAGVGLRSMRERAEELGGSLTTGPAAGGGTEVLAVLPLPESAPAVPQQRRDLATT